MDNASARPVDPKVLEFALPYLQEGIGNASSLHTRGQGALEATELAREKVAALINAENNRSITFTSGATEANNIAMRGTAKRNKGQRLLASAIEHISILNPLKELSKDGYGYELVPVDEHGLVNLDRLAEMLTEDTIVTSVMYANAEIGTIQPIKEISEIVHARGGYLHVDATVAAGWVPIDVQAEGIDLLTMSSNDMGGPQGAGALYVKPGVKIRPVVLGGGQERGLRPGTENVFAVAGMGEAARLAKSRMEKLSKRLAEIRDALVEGVLEIEGSYLTGHPDKRLPYHASFRFDRIEGESILLDMDMHGIQVATGSACSSKTLEPSHVLLAIGLKHEQAHGSMVLAVGRENSMEDVEPVVKATKDTVERLRSMSPL